MWHRRDEFDSHYSPMDFVAPITQLVECTFDKRKVVGSNPSRPTIFIIVDLFLD